MWLDWNYFAHGKSISRQKKKKSTSKQTEMQVTPVPPHFVDLWDCFSFVPPRAGPCERRLHVLRKQQHFRRRQKSLPTVWWTPSVFVILEDTQGTDEDIWRCCSCHICCCLKAFTSTPSLACELACILGMKLWSAQLPMSLLLKSASSYQSPLDNSKVRLLTPEREEQRYTAAWKQPDALRRSQTGWKHLWTMTKW